MAQGDYIADKINIEIGPTTTLASTIHIHGGGAKLTDNNFETLLGNSIPTTIRDLAIDYGATAIASTAELSLERVQIKAGTGVQALFLRAYDVSFQTTGNAIQVGALSFWIGLSSPVEPPESQPALSRTWRSRTSSSMELPTWRSIFNRRSER